MLRLKLLLLHPHLNVTGCIYLIIRKTVLKTTRVLVGQERHDLCDSYILDVVHDATENYYERGKYGYRNFHVRKTPLSMLKILKVLLFYLPMLDALCFTYLFFFKLPMHRKHVRLKCGLSFLL